MPKNKLFQSQNFPLKNYSFYFFTHFIFQKNAFHYPLETLLSNLFSAQNIKAQKTSEQPLQFLS